MEDISDISVWPRAMQAKLLQWFERYERPLPWRQNPKPYHVLVSENMLQQTTVTSVKPYYQRFMKRFPSLKSLAEANEADVLECWAGLGYYSRARNLRKTAQEIHKLGRFPRSYLKLITLPGLGPYAARAISSIAFKESVGVLDGNVIRILCRLYNLEIPWWKSSERAFLQELADKAVQGVDSSRMNQAMMELGSTLCTARSPSCLICPLLDDCQSLRAGRASSLPLSRPRREREIWVWKPVLYKHRGKIGFVKNDYAPFLKGQLLLPGSVQRQNEKPKHYDFRHSITHHDIYVQIQSEKLSSVGTDNRPSSQVDLRKGRVKGKEIEKKMGKKIKAQGKKADGWDMQWVKSHEVSQQIPFSLVKKVLSYSHQLS